LKRTTCCATIVNPMKNSTQYAADKFNEAVEVLATGQGDVRDRLLGAFRCIGPVHEGDIPVKLRDDYKWVMKMLTRGKAKYKTDFSGL